MLRSKLYASSGLAALLAAGAITAPGQDKTCRVALTYRAPGNGPAPNFSPKGTQVPLTDLGTGDPLPDGAVRPAKKGVIKIGPGQESWIPVMATADTDHPADLCRIYLDRNRNGNFADDGPAQTTAPTLNQKTGRLVEFVLPYPIVRSLRQGHERGRD